MLIKVFVGGCAFVATMCFGLAGIEYVSPGALFVAPTVAPVAAAGMYAPRPSGYSTALEAHKKGAGSTKNGRDSNSKRRGVKVYGDQPVKAGGIIIRQVGTVWHPGVNTAMGRDFTIFAKDEGVVKFEHRQGKKVISVYPPGPEPELGARKAARRATVWPPRKSAVLAMAAGTSKVDEQKKQADVEPEVEN